MIGLIDLPRPSRHEVPHTPALNPAFGPTRHKWCARGGNTIGDRSPEVERTDTAPSEFLHISQSSRSIDHSRVDRHCVGFLQLVTGCASNKNVSALGITKSRNLIGSPVTSRVMLLSFNVTS